MNPTPFAKMIIDDVHNALDCLSSGPLGLSAFDPMSSTREFKISTTPGIEVFLLPRLLKLLSEEAPNVRLTSDHLPRSVVENRLMRGDLDFAVSMDPPMAPEIKRRLLREDSLVTVARADNPLLERGFDKQTYLSAKHVAISSRQSGGGMEEVECIRHGVKRDIVARCGTISSAIKTVEVTDYLLTLGRLKLEVSGVISNLKVFDFPFSTGQALEGYLLWHESEEDDPANQWLREKITDLLKRPIVPSIEVLPS
jgi:DNA-binding transcriptional LysR family regulator